MRQIVRAGTAKEKLYHRVIDDLTGGGMPLLVGGTYAFGAYVRTNRPIKDLDLFCLPKDVGRIFRFFKRAGLRTELTDKRWLGKIFDSRSYVDIIFRSSNRKIPVSGTWFRHARTGAVLGRKVKLIAPEELILSKFSVMSRDCFHGHDIYKLIHKLGRELDWRRIWKTVKKDWQVLKAHVLLFDFVYPGERNNVPAWLRRTLLREEARSKRAVRGSSGHRGRELSLVDYATPSELKKIHAHPLFERRKIS